MHKVLPAINTSGSDSAMLDNAIEFMVMSGMELPLAVMIAIPEPWANTIKSVTEEERFLSVLCNNDGAMGRTGVYSVLTVTVMGAVLDRNGSTSFQILYYGRRYVDPVFGSRCTVILIRLRSLLKERLHPGKMLLGGYSKR